jgi:hypothetical protein
MRKIQILGAAFFAVLAFGAVVAASAWANDEWSVGGSLVGLAQTVGSVVEGKWLLVALGFGGAVETRVECNGKLIGSVNGLNASGIGTDLITNVEGLTAGETKIKCTIVSGFCTSNAVVTAEHLSWATKLLLESGATTPKDDFSEDGKGKPAFELECIEGFGGKFKELCEGNVKSEALKNEGTGTVGGKLFNQLSEKCNVSGNVAHLYGTGIIKTLSGATLTVS